MHFVSCVPTPINTLPFGEEMLPFVAAARLVGSYNQVVRDLGRHNLIILIEPHVQLLQHWSTLILDDFETKNNAQLVSRDSKVNSLLQQLVAQNKDMRSRLDCVEDKMHDVVSISDLRKQLAKKDREILHLTGSKRNCWLRICNILRGITHLQLQLKCSHPQWPQNHLPTQRKRQWILVFGWRIY